MLIANTLKIHSYCKVIFIPPRQENLIRYDKELFFMILEVRYNNIDSKSYFRKQLLSPRKQLLSPPKIIYNSCFFWQTMLEHCKNKICRQQEQCVELHNQAACIVVSEYQLLFKLFTYVVNCFMKLVSFEYLFWLSLLTIKHSLCD